MGRGTARRAIAAGAALVLISLNLRAALAGVSPVLDDIRADLGLSDVGAGLLTTTPVVCFGVAAPLAPILARRVGQEVLLLASVVAIGAGALARAAPSLGPVFAGTVVLGVGIAVANVLMPSVIKRRFERPGTMMALYTSALSLGASAAAAGAVPLAGAFGSWRWSLAFWALPAAVAVIAWLPTSIGAGRTATPGSGVAVSLWRDRTAWLVTAAFGVQSLLFYTMLSWLPDILRAAGASPGHAGTMLSVALLLGVPASLVVPVIAGRAADQRLLALVSPALWAAGWLGVLLSPGTGTVVWSVVLGLGQGAGIALGLTLVVLRAPDAGRAAALSGMAQGVGYTLAAAGPVAVGAIHHLTGDWQEPILVMLGCSALLAACGVGAGAPVEVAGTRSR